MFNSKNHYMTPYNWHYYSGNYYQMHYRSGLSRSTMTDVLQKILTKNNVPSFSMWMTSWSNVVEDLGMKMDSEKKAKWLSTSMSTLKKCRTYCQWIWKALQLRASKVSRHQASNHVSATLDWCVRVPGHLLNNLHVQIWSISSWENAIHGHVTTFLRLLVITAFLLIGSSPLTV